MKLIACCIAAIFVVAPASAQDQNQAPSKKEKPKKICVRQAVTGSMMFKRVCRTQAEIDAAALQAGKDVNADRDLQNNRSFGQSQPSGN